MHALMRRFPWLAGIFGALAALFLGAAAGTVLVAGQPEYQDTPPQQPEAPPLALLERTPAPVEAAEPARAPRYDNALPPETTRGERAAGPRLAIVIDDIGHNLEAPRSFLALQVPLTFSVLPSLPHTRDAAALIHDAGRELIVHLPMEPEAYPSVDPGPRPLLLGLNEHQTRTRLADYLRELPQAVGASNHMGSAYTRHRDRMALVQRELAGRDLLFLHSRTIATDVPTRLAREAGYRYLERDVFLDHDPASSAVTAALHKAAGVARANGQAVAIGHPHPGTLAVLQRELPRLQQDGIRLVSLTELARR